MGDDSADDDGVLTPDDLDVRDDERVVELEENRYFVSTSGDPPSDPRPEPRTADEPAAAADSEDRATAERRPLAESVERAPGHFAIAAAVRTDEGVSERVIDSNNVAVTFEGFLRWYADQIGDDRTPPDEVLRILLAETDLDL